MDSIDKKQLKEKFRVNILLVKWVINSIIIIFVSLNAEDMNELSKSSNVEGSEFKIIENDVLNSNSTMEYNVSPHDLSTLGAHGIDSFGQTGNCVFCHAENNEVENDVMWKNKSTTDSFTSNKNHNVMLSAGSLKCLSCHDGATAANTLPNGFADFTTTLAMSESNSNSNVNAAFNGRSYNSQGIGNNHPVGIVYDETKAGLNAIADLKFAKLEKGTNKITCASCHEPHGETNVSYLTVSNVGSSLCLDCHNK